MTALKIKTPDNSPLFETSYQLGVSDMNYGNHMGNDRVYAIAHEARCRFFDQENQSEISFFGTSLIMRDSQAVYLSEGKRGEHLLISIYLTQRHRFGFELQYHIREKESLRDVAQVKTGLIFYNYETKKIESSSELLDQWFEKNNFPLS